MTWNETKQNAVDPNNPASNEQIPPSEWNAHVIDQLSRAKVFTGTASPHGVVAPDSVGDLYVDTSSEGAYIATSLLNTGWEKIDGLSSVEGSAVLSSGETGGTKYLREDGDGTCSWQEVSGGSGGSGSPPLRFTYSGNVSTGLIGSVPIPDAYNGLDITEVLTSVAGLPGGQALKIDVRKNGTSTTDSINTSDVEGSIGPSETPTNGLYQVGWDTSGSTIGTSGTTLDSARVGVASNDVLNIYVTQVGSTTAGADLNVFITLG